MSESVLLLLVLIYLPHYNKNTEEMQHVFNNVKEMSGMKSVLVTGGTGFLAGWIIRNLLEKGYMVRTTVRSEKKTESVVRMLQNESVDTENLSFAVADLTKADGWDAAMEGVDSVLHVASPLGGDNHEDPSLIPIAKSGVENVLRAAVNAGIPKVVMTSSQAACFPEKSNENPALNEEFWTDIDNRYCTNYMRSKIVAEKTAWEIISKQKNTQLTTILPSAVLGPYMGGKRSSTDQIFEMILKGMPCPNVVYSVVDVRDLAELHILAMENSNTNGERILAVSEEMTMPEMARYLKQELGSKGKKINTIVIPDFLISFMAKFNAPMKVLNSMIGFKYHISNEKALSLLQWNPRPARETVLDSAKYLLDNQII